MFGAVSPFATRRGGREPAVFADELFALLRALGVAGAFALALEFAVAGLERLLRLDAMRSPKLMTQPFSLLPQAGH